MSDSRLIKYMRECGLGLGNMLAKENRVWLASKKWLVQSIVWTMVITGSVTFVLYVFTTLPVAVKPDIIESYGMGAAALQLFFNLCGFAAVIGVIILTHDLVISERSSGTAEWILSKPVSRKAFILAKLIAGITWITLIMIVLQGILLVTVVHLFHGIIEVVPFIKGLTLVWLVCLFYISMQLFLGTLTSSRGMVLGISFLFFLLGNLIPLLWPESFYFMPWKLTEIGFKFSMRIAWDGKIFLPIGLTSVFSLLFIFGALKRMEKLEI